MSRPLPASLILVVAEADAPKLTDRQIARARLVAVSLGDDRFHLIKARRTPYRFTLSHFAEPIDRLWLVRYISANLRDLG